MVYGRYNYSGWWFQRTPLKNMSSSVGMMNVPIYGTIKTCSKPPPMMFMVDITIVHGVCKVTYTWGASSWGNIAEQTRGNICGVPTMKQLT